MPKPQSPWCRGVEGQEHDVVYVHRPGTPNCQPLRGWRRQLTEQEAATPLDPRIKGQRAIARQEMWRAEAARLLRDDWECFHHEECRRCRRKLRAGGLTPQECPVARGIEPAGPPDPS